MRLPIDTGTVKFAAAGPAEPALDYETRVAKLDENLVATIRCRRGVTARDLDTHDSHHRTMEESRVCCMMIQDCESR